VPFDVELIFSTNLPPTALAIGFLPAHRPQVRSRPDERAFASSCKGWQPAPELPMTMRPRII
jgi:hypothetical protein